MAWETVDTINWLAVTSQHLQGSTRERHLHDANACYNFEYLGWESNAGLPTPDAAELPSGHSGYEQITDQGG